MKFKIPNSKFKIIVIVGPTASGKSEFAVKLAKKIGGEIISADSRQVYRGLDIGTAKVPGRWLKINSADYKRPLKTCIIYFYKNIPHHCIDFVSPKKTYTVAEFKKCAERSIADIIRRGKIPIVVGGTGFWVDAVVYDMRLPEVPPHPKLRKELQKKSAAELFKILQKLDPRRAKTVDKRNPRRLIRAIEIAKVIGKSPRSPLYQRWAGGNFKLRKSGLRSLWLGLNPPKTILEKRIKARAKKMIKRGLVEETKKLLRSGVSKKRIREFGFEYRAALDYLEQTAKENPRHAPAASRLLPERRRRLAYFKKELYDQIVRGSLQYARKQMGWFKRNPEIHWIS